MRRYLHAAAEHGPVEPAAALHAFGLHPGGALRLASRDRAGTRRARPRQRQHPQRGQSRTQDHRDQSTGASVKIVIFGLTISSSWGNGHATLWRGLCKHLARAGHSVVFFERDVPYYAGARDLHELPGGQLRLFSNWDDVLPLARSDIRDADVAIVTSYCPDAIAATELVLSEGCALPVFSDLVTPVKLSKLI